MVLRIFNKYSQIGYRTILTYKTYEDKSYKFTARKSGYVNIGDASIPKTVKYVRVVSSKLYVYFLSKGWVAATHNWGTANIN